MKELAIDKIKLLLDDLKKNKEAELKDGKSYFNTDLFAIRIKELLNILQNGSDDNEKD